MSDFDKVLERLLSDASFQAALAADPNSALAGYKLDAEERELLGTQIVSGTGGDRQVETRTTKSGMAGLLGPVVASFGLAAGGQAVGSAPGSQAVGSASGGEALGSAPGGREAMGFAADVGDAGEESFGDIDQPESVGAAPDSSSLGDAPIEAADYHTYVDVDGDGSWDRHTAYERADGGVDIHADVNNDGVVDFIGRDFDRDGLVDEAEFDTDLDGTLDTRMYDETGDGWMDRSEPIFDEEDTQSFGTAPGSG